MEEIQELWQKVCKIRERAEWRARSLPGVGLDQRLRTRHQSRNPQLIQGEKEQLDKPH